MQVLKLMNPDFHKISFFYFESMYIISIGFFLCLYDQVRNIDIFHISLQLTSYGGYLEFTLKYDLENQRRSRDRHLNEPNIVIQVRDFFY